MANSAKTSFLTGLLDGYTRTKQISKENKIKEDQRKLQTKLFEKQLEAMDLQAGAQAKIGDMLTGAGPVKDFYQNPASQDVAFPQTGAKKSILDILADPMGQQLLMQAGMKPQEIVNLNKPSGFDLSKLPPGMVLGGVKITPDGEPMYDFEMPKIEKWVPSKDGLEMIGLDRTGRELSRRPAGPDERPKPSEEDKKNKELATALEVYEQAKTGLVQGLEGTATGPLLGKLPAITSSQQTAQGGVAAMAPILKQLFRAAGEGVFTDKDQELLLAMIPTRETNTEARNAMIQNIDAIVRAKLGMSPIKQGGPKEGDIEGGYKFLGGNPADPSNWEKQ